ncbi:DUF4136 domain-containing protein [Lysobacter auxotrophicus]|uniref:DUF4136 domain-containing protein n=1 Tax=Lysobacter auxotrophicus TaxID=2992573 RepID=A0ABN6UQK4_9GAMM|nr:DUF4136 domain-containing protein [Lysobacter auxotrophicus]BDU17083.1 DUF4136 domain-containing protein [Lysobacter auxotrophicus]
MRTLAFALVCGTLLALLAPSAPAQSRKQPTAQVEVSKGASTLPGSTYAWVPMPARLQAELDKRAQDPAFRTRLQASLDKALQAKGYRRIDDVRKADLAVAYRVGVQDVQQTSVTERMQQGGVVRESAMECGPYGCSQILSKGAEGVPTFKVHTVDTVEGGLQVEVIQPADIRVLWRALYRGSIKAKDSGKLNLDAVATQTLASLPRAPAK